MSDHEGRDDESVPRDAAPRETPATSRAVTDESLLRGGLTGVTRVTVATLGLALAGALIALVVSVLY